MDSGLLIGRLILGLGLASHGAQKLFGWFDGHGPRGAGAIFETLGFRPGIVFAVLAGLGEFAGGLLTALGLFGPIGPALIVTVMIVAMACVHWPNGFFATANCVELPLAYAAGAFLIAFGGAGRYSLDAVFRLDAAFTATMAWIAVGGAFVLAFGCLGLRRPAGAAHPARTEPRTA